MSEKLLKQAELELTVEEEIISKILTSIACDERGRYRVRIENKRVVVEPVLEPILSEPDFETMMCL